jgi:signal transduction histidine kinase
MRFHFNNTLIGQTGEAPETLAAYVRDYAERGLVLGSKRLLIFAAALVLQVFYIGVVFAAILLVLIIIVEIFDGRTFALAKHAHANNPKILQKTLRRIHFSALYGSAVVSFFTLSVAFAPAGGTTFMPMLFLLAASVFVAMSCHQLVSVLVIRLTFYCATFLAIPLTALIAAGRVATPEMWLNFFASLLVLYFVIDCSIIGLRYYRTNRLQLAQLRVENDRANAALAAKTEFLSTVSHELRTPLTSIRAALDMSLAGALGPLPDKSSQVLGIAQRNATRLSKLIDELLDLQKLEAGMMKFDFCDVQIAALVEDAITDNTAYADNLGISLTMIPIDTDLTVSADPMRLEQVITNLLSNAAKFSERGNEVTLSASATPEQVRISVADNGPGVDPNARERIFDSFSQLDTTDIRKHGGTGLGLNISKRIMEAHEGLIDFAANPGGGTIFFIELARLNADPVHATPHQIDAELLLKTASRA